MTTITPYEIQILRALRRLEHELEPEALNDIRLSTLKDAVVREIRESATSAPPRPEQTSLLDTFKRAVTSRYNKISAFFISARSLEITLQDMAQRERSLVSISPRMIGKPYETYYLGSEGRRYAMYNFSELRTRSVEALMAEPKANQR